MNGFNRVTLIGNITREFEVKYLQSGTAVTEIGLAVNERRKNAQGEWVDEVTFVDVTLWSRTAEVAGEYLTKGSPIFIEGRLKLDTWETEGQKKSKLRVVGDKMIMLGGRGGGSGGGGGEGGRGGRAGAGPQQPSYDESEYGGGPPETHAAPKRSGAPAAGGGGGGPPPDEIPF